MIGQEIQLVPLDEIIVPESRQRQVNQVKAEELALSILNRGLIHTILINPETMELVVGAHRLAAYKFLRDEEEKSQSVVSPWREIPARFAIDATQFEMKALELEENIKRSQLKWNEEVLAILDYHNLRVEEDPEWSITKTSKELGISSALGSRCIILGKEIRSGSGKLDGASGITAAYNIVSREHSRAVADEMNVMSEALEESLPHIDNVNATEVRTQIEENREEHSVLTEDKTPAQQIPPVICANFLEWIETYSGPKFNILHCDFPYGINHQKSEQGRADSWGSYEDSPDTYWNLLSALCQNLDKILYPSAHVIFWFSMNYYGETLDYLNKHTNLEVNPFPLIWYKSDNKGLLPDPNRGPRRVYETALFLSRGDRNIIRPVANCYAGPGTKSTHLSEKSESMLRHFMRMVVDDLSEVLDPTCGSASALRAAESLDRKSVV